MSRVEIPNRYHSFRTIVDAWNSTLRFKNYVEVNDSGTYSVTARNKFGEASETVTLQVIRKSAYVQSYMCVQCVLGVERITE